MQKKLSPIFLEKNFYGFLLVILCFAVYGQSLHYDFFFLDDGEHITLNPLMNLSLDNFLIVWKNSKNPLVYNFWQLMTFFNQTSQAFYFRIFNLIFHILNTLLVFKISFPIFKNYKKTVENHEQTILYPFIAAIIFSFHPLQVESVIWISSFKGIIATFFALISLYLYLEKKNSFLPFIFYLLSLLCKPTLIILPLIFLLLDLLISKKNIKSSFLKLVPYILLITAFLLYKGNFNSLSVNFNLTLSQKIWVSLESFFFYLQKFIFPLNLNIIYPRSLDQVLLGLTTIKKSFLAVFFILPLLFSFFLLWKKKMHHLLFSLLAGLLLLVPTSGIVSFHYQEISTVADRYTYLTNFFWGLSLLFLIDLLLPKKTSYKNIFLGSCLFSLIFLSFHQTYLWSNETLLLTHSNNNQSYFLQYSIGLHHLKKKDFARAQDHFLNASKIDSKRMEHLPSLLKTYSQQKQYSEGKKLILSLRQKNISNTHLEEEYLRLLQNYGNEEEWQYQVHYLLRKYPYNEGLKKTIKELLEKDYKNRYSLLQQLIKNEKSPIMKDALLERATKLKKKYDRNTREFE